MPNQIKLVNFQNNSEPYLEHRTIKSELKTKTNKAKQINDIDKYEINNCSPQITSNKIKTISEFVKPDENYILWTQVNIKFCSLFVQLFIYYIDTNN